MNVNKTELDGVLLIRPPTIFQDFRGSYVETYNLALYKQAGIDVDFVQDDISTSSHHVLRGIHGDGETWKLVSCLYGRFYLVVINRVPGSPQFNAWQSFELSDQNRHQVLIPPNFGNGHVVLSEKAVYHYKQTTYYNRAGQFTLAWDDPELGIRWPVENPVVSERDKGISDV